jgi:phenylacetic acid degradation operon negative regulatory protein
MSEDHMTLPTRGRLKARSMLFDLFGDFAEENGRGGAIRLAAITHLAGELGVSETAVRSAATRLVQDNWLTTRRQGRQSIYLLTERGRDLIEQGRRRIFDRQVGASWDGTWCVVALAIPEARREVRDRLRKQLSWLGFGSPGSALYISPRDHASAVIRLAEGLEASGNITLYRSQALWPADPRALVGRAWSDLDTLALGYWKFAGHFGPRLSEDRVRLARAELSDSEAFRTRFTLVSEFRRCIFGDPDLPPELLRPDWPGPAARAIFLEYHDLVSPAALKFFDRITST